MKGYTLANVSGGPCIACGTGKLRKSKGHHPVIQCKNCGAAWSTGGRLLRNPYVLLKGEKETYFDFDSKKEKKGYRGRTRSITELPLPTIESAHRVAKIAGIKTYGITDEKDMFGREAVFKTKDIMDYEAASKIERDTETQKKLLKVEQLKKTPKKIVIKKYPGRISVYAERGKPDYSPRMRSQVTMYSTVYIKVPGTTPMRGKKEARPLHLDSFITRGGVVQKKKFMDEWAYYFGGEASRRAIPARYSRHAGRMGTGSPAVPGVYPPALKDIAEDLKEINARYKKIKDTIWNTSTYSMNPRRKR